MSEYLSFFSQFIRRPKQMGALVPSSTQLGSVMVSKASLRPGMFVVELGGGTGSITRNIVADAPHCPLWVLEPNPELACRLLEKFTNIEVFCQGVEALPQIIAECQTGYVDRVISSLPWAVWSKEEQNRRLNAVCSVMMPSSRFITFQYAHSRLLPNARRFESLLEKRFGIVEKTDIQWRNLPPAFVYVCRELSH